MVPIPDSLASATAADFAGPANRAAALFAALIAVLDLREPDYKT
jgi:hypothetical protein